MGKGLRYLGQAVLYALFFLPLVYFSHAPGYPVLGEDLAVLKVAVRHAGKTVGECTSAAASGHGMRPSSMTQTIQVCPRERSPLLLELILDGETIYRVNVPASGLHRDGISSVYHRFNVPTGPHHLLLRMNDDAAIEGFTWQFEQDIELRASQVMVASFKGGFKLQ